MDRSRGLVLGPTSNRRGVESRSVYNTHGSFYDDVPGGLSSQYYYRRDFDVLYPGREDCSCTSVSEEEDENEVRMNESFGSNQSNAISPSSANNESKSFPAKKPPPKKKCQLNKFVNQHLHRRHYPEYYGTHFSHPSRSNYESDSHQYLSNHYAGLNTIYSQRSSPPPHPFQQQPQVKTSSRSTTSSAHKNHHVPHYLENIILNSHNINKPQHDAELMKKLSKCIIIPENPEDPAAFTVTPGFTGTPKPPWCSSKPVQKIVGTFVILMSLGIIAAVLYVNWSSNTFRPMMK